MCTFQNRRSFSHACETAVTLFITHLALSNNPLLTYFSLSAPPASFADRSHPPNRATIDIKDFENDSHLGFILLKDIGDLKYLLLYRCYFVFLTQHYIYLSYHVEFDRLVYCCDYNRLSQTQVNCDLYLPLPLYEALGLQ